ncbi:hypothetical protein PoB_001120900 [Plakobranchus ocellatus]|uniref:Uncharacterized protein n=1 Tax=Plakobranchus ocellatus TaxID=259542 RepID=A0AAV3YNT8_9GAST|nr:hypothetical protein PoB_001120900 [Plakobranchus ocellatus]
MILPRKDSRVKLAAARKTLESLWRPSKHSGVYLAAVNSTLVYLVAVNSTLEAARLQKEPEQIRAVEIQHIHGPKLESNICSMPLSQEKITYMMVTDDYFSKWTEADALYRKTAEGIETF